MNNIQLKARIENHHWIFTKVDNGQAVEITFQELAGLYQQKREEAKRG